MLPSGRSVGGYRIASYIARGGFSEVYKAHSKHDSALVALKVLSLTLPDELISAERLGASLQQRFEQAHGMVPRTFEVSQDDDYFFIAMACIAGPSLDAEIARGPIDPVRAARHATSICRFLELAHRFATTIDGVSYDKVIHADLKPSHIFIGADGGLTVLDFGISKALEKSRTAKTIRFVTPLYASPQRLQTGRGSEQDDRWAAAVMLYEMVRGRRPHSSIEDPPTYSRLSRAIEACAKREPLPASCPRALAAIIDKGLAFQEELRYESAGAMRADLEAFLRRESPQAMKQFATAPTIRVNAQPSAIARSAAPPTPAPAALTLDMPAAGGVAIAMPPVGALQVRAPRTSVVRRAVGPAVMAVVAMLFASESVAWLGAERLRAGLPALGVAEVAVAHQHYERQQHWSLFHIGQRLRLDRPLKDRLMSAADAVLADYRRDDSSVTEGQWRRTSEALDWASELSPDDATIAPKQLVARGHLDRIAAQIRARTSPAEAQEVYQRAIDEFTRAASLGPGAADPYLGLSRVYIYGQNDVDRGAAAIHEAESRGYTAGWRDRAQLGDGYRQRADEARRTARLTDDDRIQVLRGARDDYARCVETLTPVVDRGNWKANRDYCQRHLDALNRELDGEPGGGQ